MELIRHVFVLITAFLASFFISTTPVPIPSPAASPIVVSSPTPTPTIRPIIHPSPKPKPKPTPTVVASSAPTPYYPPADAPLYDKSNTNASVKVSVSPQSLCPGETKSFVLQTQYYEAIFDNNSKDYTYVNTTGYEATFSNLYPGTYNVFFQYCGKTSTYYQVHPKANETVTVNIAIF